jgi:5-methylcytosine-specific restriction enzyme subunit McrC
MNRLTSAYEPALTLIEMLVQARGITFENDEPSVSLPGLLFDMNQLFQAVLSRFLRENLADFTVRDEYRLKGMLTYHPQRNPWHGTAPTPRPDYAVTRGARVVALLDAKYMDLWERRGIGRDVLYQLAIYALSQPADTTATILYPAGDPAATDVQVDINDPVFGKSRAHVMARPVRLDVLETLLTETTAPGAVRERAAYARWLVFGDSAAA